MKATYEWKNMLKAICKERGLEENENCKIKYEAQADAEENKLTFVAKIYPYGQVEEIDITAVIE